MHLVTSYFLVRRLAGAIQLGNVSSTAPRSGSRNVGRGGHHRDHYYSSSASSSSTPSTSPTASAVHSITLREAKESRQHYWDDAFQERQFEYLFSLWKNTLHPDVEAVHLLIEGKDAYQHFCQHVRTSTPSSSFTAPADAVLSWTAEQQRKIVPMLRFGPPPTYKDLFQYAAQILPQKIVMVCNADVYLSPFSSLSTSFSAPSTTSLTTKTVLAPPQGRGSGLLSEAKEDPESLSSFFFEENAPPPIAFALTRYEAELGGPLSPALSDAAPLIHAYRGSHDGFILQPSSRSPLSTTPFLQRVHHRQNCYQAENIVIYELQQAGYLVLNPCLGKDGLRLIHCHEEKTGVRQWFPSVDPTRYGRALPMGMEEVLAVVQKERKQCVL